jgi:hypothetical protein
VTYDAGLHSWWDRARYWLRINVPGANAAINVLRRRPADTPVMQMNRYSITRLLDILKNEGCGEVYVRFTDHGGARGALLFARKLELPNFD